MRAKPPLRQRSASHRCAHFYGLSGCWAQAVRSWPCSSVVSRCSSCRLYAGDPLGSKVRSVPLPCRLPATPFTADDFPSLGSTTAGNSTSSQAGSTAGYASKARATADLPAQPRSSGASSAWQRPSAAAAAAAAARTATPIWQAQGVQQFGTGAAAANEYVELRAEASDHARLAVLNFQQV